MLLDKILCDMLGATEKHYALYYAAQKKYVWGMSTWDINGTSWRPDLADSPRFIKTTKTLFEWQTTCAIKGFDTEIQEFDIQIKLTNQPRHAAVNHVLKIREELVGVNVQSMEFGPLGEKLMKDHARYLVFYLPHGTSRYTWNDEKGQHIDEIKSRVRKAKCNSINIQTKHGQYGLYFFEENIDNLVLLRLTANSAVIIYDTQEMIFL